MSPRAANNCTCLHCGKPFRVIPAIIKRGGGKYCSQPCASKRDQRTPLADRFFAGVGRKDANGCIPWIGSSNFLLFSGGSSGKGGMNLVASRVAYMLCVGPIPKGLSVLHRCDRGLYCINPTHLFLGTQTDNMADMVAKGRQAKGETRGTNKLTEAQVREARQRHENGETNASIARSLGVTRTNIISVVKRKTWAHVP